MCRAWIRRAYPNRVRTSRRIRLGEHHVHELGGGVDSQGCLWSFYKKRKKRREREKERENVNKLPCLSPSLYPILTPCCYSFTSSPLAFCAPLPPSPDACIYTWFLEYCPHGVSVVRERVGGPVVSVGRNEVHTWKMCCFILFKYVSTFYIY